VLACGISYIRTFIELRTLNSALFTRTLIPVGLMFIYLMIVGLYLLLGKKHENITHSAEFKTPFELTEAIKLGGFIIGALLIAKIVLSYAGISIYYIVASLMAFFAIDDPVVISTAASAGKLITFDQAKNIVLLIVFLNMAQKVGLMYFFGNRKLVKPMAIIFGGLLIVTLAGFFFF
jgi:uncharacterized membrane protein (DUF4010 family)